MTYSRVRAIGQGPFPVDMLRFLQAWPATSHDAAVIVHSQVAGMTPGGDSARRTVIIECAGRTVEPFLLARFDSFGWSSELMAGLGSRPLQDPSEPVRQPVNPPVRQSVRYSMTPELMELRERMHPAPAEGMAGSWRDGPFVIIGGNWYALCAGVLVGGPVLENGAPSLDDMGSVEGTSDDIERAHRMLLAGA